MCSKIQDEPFPPLLSSVSIDWTGDARAKAKQMVTTKSDSDTAAGVFLQLKANSNELSPGPIEISFENSTVWSCEQLLAAKGNAAGGILEERSAVDPSTAVSLSVECSIAESSHGVVCNDQTKSAKNVKQKPDQEAAEKSCSFANMNSLEIKLEEDDSQPSTEAHPTSRLLAKRRALKLLVATADDDDMTPAVHSPVPESKSHTPIPAAGESEMVLNSEQIQPSSALRSRRQQMQLAVAIAGDDIHE